MQYARVLKGEGIVLNAGGLEDVAWIKLHLGEVELSGSPSAGNASLPRITTKADGYVQVLDPSSPA